MKNIGAPEHADVSYGPNGRHKLDVYLPTSDQNRGTIVTVHGGAFVEGSKGEVPKYFGVVMRLRAKGFSVVAVNYRLMANGKNRFPTAIDDVALAVKWLREHAEEVGVNTESIIVAGMSAGGTIASLLGTAANSPGWERLPRVDGWVSFAGIYDFTVNDPLIPRIRRDWLGSNDPGIARKASAVTHIDKKDPPGFVVHGDHDNVVPVYQMFALRNAAASRGIVDRLWHQTVDFNLIDRSAGIEVQCRRHLPMCGTNYAELSRFVEAVANGSFDGRV